MDLLVVAAAGDPLAGVVALAAEGRGKKAVVMDHVHAARLFSIGGDGETLSAVLFDILLLGYEVLFFATGDRKPSTMFGKRPGDAAGDAGSAPGYKRNFPL